MYLLTRVNLRINEDIVNIQLDVGDRLGSVDVTTSSERWGKGDVLFDIKYCLRVRETLCSMYRGLSLGGKLEEQITGGSEKNIILGLNIDNDKSHSIGDRDRSDREPWITIEPENHSVIHSYYLL